MDQAIQPSGFTRRGFLAKALIGVAAAAGVTALAQQKFFGKQIAATPLVLPEDSIFMPRADQRRKVLGGD